MISTGTMLLLLAACAPRPAVEPVTQPATKPADEATPALVSVAMRLMLLDREVFREMGIPRTVAPDAPVHVIDDLDQNLLIRVAQLHGMSCAIPRITLSPSSGALPVGTRRITYGSLDDPGPRRDWDPRLTGTTQLAPGPTPDTVLLVLRLRPPRPPVVGQPETDAELAVTEAEVRLTMRHRQTVLVRLPFEAVRLQDFEADPGDAAVVSHAERQLATPANPLAEGDHVVPLLVRPTFIDEAQAEANARAAANRSPPQRSDEK